MAVIAEQIFNWVVYKIVSPTNKIYIGITRNYERRIKSYKYAQCYNQHNVLNSIKKYGFESHKLEVIERIASNQNFAFEREIYWIEQYKSFRKKYPSEKGLNLTAGGAGHKAPLTPKNKERISRKGIKWSDAMRAKMTPHPLLGKKMNRIYTEAQIQCLRERGSKLRHSPEAKSKIRATSLGNKYGLGMGHRKTQEGKESQRKAMLGNRYGKGPNENNKAALRAVAHKRRKTIQQFDLKGNLLGEFNGVISAQKTLGINNISPVVNGKLRHTRGFIFKLKTA